MREVTDMMGHPVKVPAYPRRIVSLVPSQTELLWDLGLQDRLVGITKFCIHPDIAFKTIPHIGGTKNINLERLVGVRPDLIIGNKEENTKLEIEALRVWYPVWMSDILTLDDALTMITEIGDLTQTTAKAEALAQDIRMAFADLDTHLNAEPATAIYLIWRQPYMAAGPGTFIHDIMHRAGYRNIAPAERYPHLTIEDMIALKPQHILLSSEPYPFKQEHIAELQTHLPQATIQQVDGEMFSWYGSRLLKVPDYLKGLRLPN
jgi:ABC-type Fe3+-hydroxamate transport system substrate-binding protein